METGESEAIYTISRAEDEKYAMGEGIRISLNTEESRRG